MMLTSIFLSALACRAALAVPPASFGFPTSEGNTTLSVTFQSNGQPLQVQPGELFGIDVPAQQPTIAVNTSSTYLSTNYTGQYMFIMVDPDASYPQSPNNRFIIHWWQLNMTRSTQASDTSDSIGGTLLVNGSAPRVAYRRPAPPSNSSAHRYIQYLFEQPPNFTFPSAYAGYGGTNSSRFNLTGFLQAARFNDPVAANYFYCSNQSNISSTFVAAPGSQYPGGNGNAITSGPGPSVTPSATSGGASGSASQASSSGSSSASSSASAAAAARGFVAGSSTVVGALLALLMM